MKSKKAHIVDSLRRRKQRKEEVEVIPRITNETVAAHREEVLGKARRYILPLAHSKHQIVRISIFLFVAFIVSFFTYCTLALYRFQTNSTFLYRVTQVLPFPIARSGATFVSYEDYFFELRHYMHYYQNQQEVDFNSGAGKAQLLEFKKRAKEKVINDAYVAQIAKEKDITVSNQEVEDQIILLRNQNRLGDGEKVLEDVLKEYYDWSLDDFKRSIRLQLLSQKVVAVLDTETTARAQAALAELKSGADFAAVAMKYSEDPATNPRGGEFETPIDRKSQEVTPMSAEALFLLQPGQVSEVINIGYELEILKNIEAVGSDRIRASHIIFRLKDISTYINERKEKHPMRFYISIK